MNARFSKPKADPLFVQNDLWPIRHGFFGLYGGIGPLQHAALQASCLPVHSDSPHSIHSDQQNRCALIKTVARASLAALHFTGTAWLSNQKHTNRVLVLPRDQQSIMQPADALITNDPDAFIGIITADCAPILIYDGVAKVIAAIHAGWRGAVSGIIEETVRQMYAMGATISNLQATIGPMIRSASYQVSPDFVQTVQDASAWNISTMVRTVGDCVFFDLPLYIHKRLESLVSNITDIHIDTFSRTDFFSHRRATHHQKQANRDNRTGFDKWSEQSGCKSEHQKITENTSVKNAMMPPLGETLGESLGNESVTCWAEGSGENSPNSHGRNISWISLAARTNPL
ncbi:MAG: peptidoglycan editing factor PgeF [Alphaproteobacteria bacterium]|nr:peptidoglycan editing factor PgeF [Alphaproteobacteria bacterium]